MSSFKDLTIGVLELQGDFAEHTAMLQACGVGKVVGVRQRDDLSTGIDALVIPGGESTTMAKLLLAQDMMDDVRDMGRRGLPMFGTCAGCILLAQEIRQRPDQPSLQLLDVSVDRNAYGKQIDSFETFIDSPFLQQQDQNDGGNKSTPKPLRVVQIRAPMIARTSQKVQVLASHKGNPVLVKQGSVLACTFHPELTRDTRVHRLFLNIVLESKQAKSESS